MPSLDGGSTAQGQLSARLLTNLVLARLISRSKEPTGPATKRRQKREAASEHQHGALSLLPQGKTLPIPFLMIKLILVILALFIFHLLFR